MKIKLFETYKNDARFKNPNTYDNVLYNAKAWHFVNLPGFKINDDLSITCLDNVDISSSNLTYIPFKFKNSIIWFLFSTTIW